MTAQELVENAGVPDRFRQITILYLEAYEAQVSDVYRTLRHKGHRPRTFLAIHS